MSISYVHYCRVLLGSTVSGWFGWLSVFFSFLFPFSIGRKPVGLDNQLFQLATAWLKRLKTVGSVR